MRRSVPRVLGIPSIVVALIVAATSCATAPPAPASRSAQRDFPLTVLDDDGRSVTFAAPPQRIVSLSPGFTETLYALGAGSRVVLTDKFSDYPAENASKAKLGTFPKPSLEDIYAARPDLVVTLTAPEDFISRLEDLGLPALHLFPKTFDGALRDIALLGDVTGASSLGHSLTAGMRARADAVRARTTNAPAVRVYYELDATNPARPFAAGPLGFFGELVPLAGGRNVFGDLTTPSAAVSSEEVVRRDPEVIILSDADLPENPQTSALVRERPGWSAIAAVRAGRVYPLSHAYLERPGPRLIDGLEQLARLIHPELFP